MAGKIGHEKAGGRQIGSKNKVTNAVKERITDIVAKYVTEGGVRRMESDLEVMRPAERIAIIEKLMKYVLPTLGTVTHKGDADEPVQITVSYKATPIAQPGDEDENIEDIDYSEDV